MIFPNGLPQKFRMCVEFLGDFCLEAHQYPRKEVAGNCDTNIAWSSPSLGESGSRFLLLLCWASPKLKTWSVSPSWEFLESLQDLGAGEDIPCALQDPSLLMNSWRVWDRIQLAFGWEALALWKKCSVS